MPSARPFVIGLVALVALALGVLTGLVWLRAPSASDTATVIEPPRPLPELALVDQDGRPFTRATLLGHWSLVFAGYTYCPDVCPATLALLREVQKQLPADVPHPQVVFLSVDPERDTPVRLKQYVEYFDAGFVGVTAPEPQLAAATGAFGIAYARVPGASEQDYSVDHSALLALVDPQARIKAYFLPPLKADALRDNLAALTRSGS